MPDSNRPPSDQIPRSHHASCEQSRPSIALSATKHVQPSWTDQQDGLTSLTLETALADIPLEDLAGALTSKKEDRFSIPLILDYSDTTRRTSYRLGDAVVDLPSGRTPCGTSWVEIDPRMSLKRALELYGRHLLAFEKVVRHVSLEIVVFVRERRQLTLRVLIRRPTQTS